MKNIEISAIELTPDDELNNTIISDNDKNSNQNITPISFRVLSSLFSGIFTSLSTIPLEVAKTRMQSQLDLNKHNTTKKYSGTINTIYKIARYEGITSLYRGLTPTLIQILPGSAIYFPLYEEIKQFLDKNNSQWKNNVNPLISGIISRTIVVTMLGPIEYLRTNIQSRKVGGTVPDNLFELSRSIIRAQGVWGLWSGLSSTLFRDVIFSGIYWSSYETSRSYLVHQFDSTQHNLLINFLSGYTSGSLSCILTHPFDIIKTQNQMNIQKQNRTMLDYFKLIYQSEGLKGFTVGLVPRLIRVGPACGIMIASYEFLKNLIY